MKYDLVECIDARGICGLWKGRICRVYICVRLSGEEYLAVEEYRFGFIPASRFRPVSEHQRATVAALMERALA